MNKGGEAVRRVKELYPDQSEMGADFGYLFKGDRGWWNIFVSALLSIS